MNEKEYILHNIAAKYILNETVDIELKGKPAEIDCLFDLLEVSKSLKESLDKNESIDKISNLLEKKKILTKKFEEISNIRWML